MADHYGDAERTFVGYAIQMSLLTSLIAAKT